MKIHKISWFDEFNCMGGDCPGTCCRGWLIPLDGEDVCRFKKEKGRLGLELFLATGAYTRTRMNLGSGECRFHMGDGLCKLQLRKGHDFIPWACRSYPRFYRNYGDLEERYLDLSCIAAAEMFVRNTGPLKLVEDVDEPVTGLCTTNDDEDLLDTLVKMRQDIIDKIEEIFRQDMRSCRALMDTLYDHSCRLQDTYARGGYYKDLPPVKDVLGTMEEKSHTFPVPPYILKGFTEAALGHFGQKKTGTGLHGLLTDALNLTKNYRVERSRFDEAAGEFCDLNELMLPLLGKYMSYYLYQYFLGTYETYSFRKAVALGIIHTNMILLLAMAYVPGGRRVTGDDLAYIISVYNRKVFFNETIEDLMYEIFEGYVQT
ncbi:MAG: flagellin lysine-N-methylase [Lachnospiraceae bacterium]|nr:flagellin lysine-N-methylase [Lachnospiraceae bacterium]